MRWMLAAVLVLVAPVAGCFEKLGPAITRAQPERAHAGEVITVSGRNLMVPPAWRRVTVNGASVATVTTWTTDCFAIVVPDGHHGKGEIVGTLGEDVRVSLPFEILVPDPVVTALEPGEGRPGDSVVITGQHFGQSQGTVTIDGCEAKVSQWTSASVKIVVPDAISKGSIVLKTTDGNAASPQVLELVRPIVESVECLSMAPSEPVTIKGRGFGESTEHAFVAFDGQKATRYDQWTPTVVRLRVPGVVSGGPSLSLQVSVRGLTSAPRLLPSGKTKYSIVTYGKSSPAWASIVSLQRLIRTTRKSQLAAFASALDAFDANSPGRSNFAEVAAQSRASRASGASMQELAARRDAKLADLARDCAAKLSVTDEQLPQDAIVDVLLDEANRQVAEELGAAKRESGAKSLAVGKVFEIVGQDGAAMVLVSAGEFLMGVEDGGAEQMPVHQVYVDAFFIDKYEVTNRLFAKFVDATKYRTDAEQTRRAWAIEGRYDDLVPVELADWRHPSGPLSTIEGKPDHPVVQVSWGDAQAYCQWAGKRLPTEAEWEKAARGTDVRLYPWGNDPLGEGEASPANSGESGDRRIWKRKGYDRTAPIGLFRSDVSPYGAFDMSGNVSEWCSDWYGDRYYEGSPVKNPAGPDTGPSHVIRGGSWYGGPGGGSMRSAARGWTRLPERRCDYVGFRCVKAAK